MVCPPVGAIVAKGKYFTCPSRESNPGRWIYRQTLYQVAVKAGFYRKAVEVYLYLLRPCDISISTLAYFILFQFPHLIFIPTLASIFYISSLELLLSHFQFMNCSLSSALASSCFHITHTHLLLHVGVFLTDAEFDKDQI